MNATEELGSTRIQKIVTETHGQRSEQQHNARNNQKSNRDKASNEVTSSRVDILHPLGFGGYRKARKYPQGLVSWILPHRAVLHDTRNRN